MSQSELIRQAVAFGPGMFFAVIMILLMVYVLRWVFKMFETHVKQLSDNMSLTAKLIQGLHDDIRSHTETEGKAAEYQRQEHMAITKAQTDTLMEMKSLVLAVRDFECKARA